jgi:hypothetical protein
LRVAVDNNFASRSFNCARAADARLAAAAVLAVLFTRFEAATFRRAALTGFFAVLDLAGFRFDSFAATVLVLARLGLLVLRATRVFDADLLFVARLRALDEEAPFVVRFAFGFALEAEPVFFVFELVVFLDFLGATIANLSTRKLSRTRYSSGTNTASDPCTNIALRTAS